MNDCAEARADHRLRGWRGAAWGVTSGVVLVVLLVSVLRAGEAMAPAHTPQSDYTLACAGCHGLEGVSNSTLVPALKGLVGYYLNLPEGRAYLSRVPNVAFSSLNDRELAAVLNYMVFALGADSVPAGTKPYSAAEVGKFRRQPLTEVPLFKYRERMVETLIQQYHAPSTLRIYGQDFYGAQE